VLQGLVTGIGFLGGGAILKLTAEHEITASDRGRASWLTAAASAAGWVNSPCDSRVCLGLLASAFVKWKATRHRLPGRRNRKAPERSRRTDDGDD